MREEADYIQRIEAQQENYTMEGYMEKQYDFGTILFRTNREDPPDVIYKLYKARSEIEQTFDFLKNLLDADTLYLQDKNATEGWAFINHNSLLLTYLVYDRLRRANLLDRFSIRDFITHLKYIFMVKTKSLWVPSEISGKTMKLLDALSLSIT